MSNDGPIDSFRGFDCHGNRCNCACHRGVNVKHFVACCYITNPKEPPFMQKNIAAFTETQYTGSYPAYLSINKWKDDGRIVLTARERGHDGNKSVTMELSPEELEAFATMIIAGLNTDD